MPDITLPSAGALTQALPPSQARAVDAPFAQAIVELGHERPEVVVLSADLSKYTDIAPFAQEFPDRFFQVGMAEQNMIGIAGGLAKAGKIPIAVTYCVFASRRAGDQIQMALSTGGLTSVVAAFLPGITTPFRASHQGTDDLAIMRAIPGMTVVDPLDATELAGALKAAVDVRGPVYLRGLRGQVPAIFNPEEPFAIGRARLLKDGGQLGVVGTGLGTGWAMEALETMGSTGDEVGLLHVPTLKPLDTESVLTFASRHRVLITIENHSIIGGLGSAICETVAGAGLACRVQRLGVPDRWGDAGPLDFVREKMGLDAARLAKTFTGSLGGN